MGVVREYIRPTCVVLLTCTILAFVVSRDGFSAGMAASAPRFDVEQAPSVPTGLMVVVGETTPPLISSISAGSITSSGATITWATNEASDSQVLYGVTTGYGFASPLNTSLVTSHSVMLNGLNQASQYHFAVRSRDAAGNLSVSGDVTFTTLASSDVTPPTVSITSPAAGAAVSGSVLVTANASDNVGVVGVQFRVDGAPVGPEDTTAPFSATWDTTSAPNGSHTLTAVARDLATNSAASAGSAVSVANGSSQISLQPQDTSLNVNATNFSSDTTLTTYTWPDNQVANAILMKFDLSAIPAGAVIEQATLRLSLLQADATADATYAVTAHKVLGKNPVIASATGYTADGVTPWTANSCCSNNVPLAQADISLPYDTQAINKVPGSKLWTLTTLVQEWRAAPASNFGLLLNSDTSRLRDRYRYFASMEHTDPTLRPSLTITYSLVADVTPPVISSVVASAISTSGATIAWTTNETSNSQVDYGTSTAYGSSTTLNSTMVSAHSMALTGLTAGTLYHYRVRSRDPAGNLAVSGDFTFTSSSSGTAGIAALYPGDVGIENHASVVFVERFDEPTLTALFNRWTQIHNGPTMSFSPDVPPGSPLARSLNVPWTGGGVSDGGHLYKKLTPGIDDTLYVRYYIKYPTSGNYHHDGIWFGGYNPPLNFPNPQAGVKPAGNDRFAASAEQRDDHSKFDHYNYWMNMRSASDGKYWGNSLLNKPSVTVSEGQWTCIEHMVKLNNPVTAFNGEHAIWINGVKVSHLGQGFPNGSWNWITFTQNPAGTPFEGFRWRSDPNLNINYLWLQNYSDSDPPGFTSSIKFAHVVAAKSYIGCLP